MKNQLPVIAAIPAYNAEETLPVLLEDVLAQNYDRVIVLDDGSTDHTIDVACDYGRDVRVVLNKTNLGPGGNRNRIIGSVQDSILHFLDADVRLNSTDTPEIARELMSGPDDYGYVGGLVRNPDGRQNPYNFGPRPSPKNDISSFAQYGLFNLSNNHPVAAAKIRNRFSDYLASCPNAFEAPSAREVFWSSEANMVIKSKIFADLGGYDPRFRFSEIFDFSIRLGAVGLKRLFDPALDVTHNETDRAEEKVGGRSKAQLQLIAKYGVLNYLTGAGMPRKRSA